MIPASAPGSAVLAADSPSRDNAASILCWYHRRFGARDKSVLRPAPAASRGTNASEIKGGTCLR
jgi:hypothetical protein